jgi:hypothetical protein
VSNTILLDHLRDLRDERHASDLRFRRVIVLGHAIGVPVPELADAAHLSTSRIHGILEQEGKPPHEVLDTSEIEYVLESANTVAVVPANGVAYKDYDRYSAYLCQARRTFRSETSRLGFYADREIKPEFPKILRVWEAVILCDETVAQLRASSESDDAKLADIVDDVLAHGTGGRKPGFHMKVMLLSARGDKNTLTLDHPIRHGGRGRGMAWVRRQRYISELALRRQPKTTDELRAG